MYPCPLLRLHRAFGVAGRSADGLKQVVEELGAQDRLKVISGVDVTNYDSVLRMAQTARWDPSRGMMSARFMRGAYCIPQYRKDHGTVSDLATTFSWPERFDQLFGSAVLSTTYLCDQCVLDQYGARWGLLLHC